MAFRIEQIQKEGAVTAAASGAECAKLVTPGYAEGDTLAFHTGEARYVWVQVHPQVAEALVYVPAGRFFFPIPQGEALRGFAPGTFAGPQTVTLRPASAAERKSRRNLCLNPLDYRVASEGTDPDAPEGENAGASGAVAAGEILAFPHVYANRVTRNEGCFYARNAIDGKSAPGGHGDYPYHTWGGGLHEDLNLTVYFGRPVAAETLGLCLRSDYRTDEQGREHDTYWNRVVVELSDGTRLEVHPEKSADTQQFDLGGRRVEWVRLAKLEPFRHQGSLNFAALSQIEVWGRDID